VKIDFSRNQYLISEFNQIVVVHDWDLPEASIVKPRSAYNTGKSFISQNTSTTN
jgi:hypothetical protein